MKKIQIMESSQVKALPLGAQTENGSVHVAFVSDREGTARIHLYKKGRDAEACSFVFPEENRLGDVRYIGLSGFAPSEYEYSLSVNGETVEDPYARLTAGREKWGIAPSGERSARYAFLREDFDWEDDRKPGYAFEDTILYRLHVRGFTRHPSSGVSHKGTFAGIAEKIPYLKELGVTMAELMLPYEFKEVRELPAGRRVPAGSGAAAQAGPVREADAPVNGTAPVNGAVPAAGPGGMAAVFPAAGYGGKLNYWGYGPACCFAPKAAYCVRGAQYGTPDIQFKSLVKEFHKNGLEIAVELYFEPDAGTPYILDCLRFWVEEYHVDGIHIAGTFDGKAVSEDPVLRGVKLFAGDWSRESAGKKRYLAVYRDDFQTDMRRFIKGDEDQLRNLVYHMKENGGAFGKVNFMANTNGFTMMDMVSYDRKHNEKNGEDGRDGTDYNYSWNCGAEGPARKRKILELRKKQLRNAWTILMTAQGMPLILAGDEFGNSQDGNNNAYCQDNATGWVEWKKGRLNDEIARFARFMIRFRKAHPMLHRAGGLRSMDYKGVGCPDFSVHGEAPWYPQYENYRRQLGLLYKGSYAGEEADSDLYIMFNMHWETHAFSLPHAGGQWHLAVYTADEERNGIYEEPELLEDQETFEMAPRSIAILTAKEAGNMTEKTKGLSGLALKWIAVVTMFVDHLAIALAGIIPSGAYDGMRIVGRLAFPLFCFLLVEGFYHTGNIRKYLIRLGVFALISEIPFDFLLFGRVVYMGYQNVFFTLFTGLLLLYLYNRFLGNVQPIYAAMTLISMLCLAFVIQCDYGAEGVLLIFLIYFFHYRPVAMMVSIAVVMAVMGGIEPFGILAIVPIAFYNGRRGGRVMEEETNEKDMARDFRKGLAAKYFFYCFYPLHLAVLGVLKYLLH